jgi:hypothetical protein
VIEDHREVVKALRAEFGIDAGVSGSTQAHIDRKRVRAIRHFFQSVSPMHGRHTPAFRR